MRTTPPPIVPIAPIVGPAGKSAALLPRDIPPLFALLACAVAGIAVMYLTGGYRLLQYTQMLVFAIAILGLNLLSGYNGQISLGHGAFFAIGGYATAVLITKLGLPFWAAVPCAGVASLVVGLLIGLPALRLDMLYLALATFSLAVAVPQLLKNKFVESWTGGVQGLQIPKVEPWSAIGLDRDQTIYLYALLVALLLFATTIGLLRGRVGRALEAIRDHQLAAETMGVDVNRYKTAAFGVSALFTGIAGGIGAVVTSFVAPDSYSFFLSITLLVGAVIGGLHSMFGALLGGVFVVLMPNYAEQISQAAPWAIYGVFLIVFTYFMPDGAMGALRAAWKRLARA